MENIEQILRIMRDGHFPLPPKTYLLEDIPADIKLRIKQFDPEEKLLMAMDSETAVFSIKEKKVPAIQCAITDKHIYLAKEVECFNYLTPFPLNEIKFIRLGREVWTRTSSAHYASTIHYAGTAVLINGKETGFVTGMIWLISRKAYVNMLTANGSFYDPLTTRFWEYLFKAMSGNYTLDEQKQELSEWANAPKEQLMTMGLYSNYCVLAVSSLGIYHMKMMYNIQKAIEKLSADHQEDEPMKNYFIAFLLGILTLGVYWFIWRHQLVERMRKEWDRRNIDGKPLPVRSLLDMKGIIESTNRLIDHYNHNG